MTFDGRRATSLGWMTSFFFFFSLRSTAHYLCIRRQLALQSRVRMILEFEIWSPLMVVKFLLNTPYNVQKFNGHWVTQIWAYRVTESSQKSSQWHIDIHGIDAVVRNFRWVGPGLIKMGVSLPNNRSKGPPVTLMHQFGCKIKRI